MNALFLVLTITGIFALKHNYRWFALILSLALVDVVFFSARGVASLYQHILLDAVVLSFAYFLRIDNDSKKIIISLIIMHLTCLISYEFSLFYSIVKTLYQIATTASFAALLCNISIKSSSLPSYTAPSHDKADRNFYPKEIINEIECRRL